MDTTVQAPARAGSRLRGFDSGAREIADTTVRVRGTLPGWLRGSLLLNGPALWDLPGGRLQHWFDGYAMLHRLAFAADGVRYRSRFFQSQAYRASVAAGRPSTGEFGSPNPAALWRRIMGANVTDNPAVVMSRHGKRWFAVTETPSLTYFDPETLQTRERLDLGPLLKIQLMAAHGFTLADGSYLNVGVELGPRCKYRVFRLPAGQGSAQAIADIPVARSGYLHGFGLAPGHAIVWDCAIRVNALGLRFGARSYRDNFHWEPDGGSMLHAVALDGGAVRSWSIPPLMAFHANQAWSEGDDLLIEIATFANGDIFDDLMLERRRSDAPITTSPRLKRYRLRPGQAAAEVEDLGVTLELPQVHPAALGVRRASVCWGMGVSSQGRFVDHVLRLDLDRNVVTTWQRSDAAHFEPLFVPRPGGTADDDGVLLVPTLASVDAAGVVAVVDAATMQCLAEIEAPQVLPFGFHAAFHGTGD